MYVRVCGVCRLRVVSGFTRHTHIRVIQPWREGTLWGYGSPRCLSKVWWETNGGPAVFFTARGPQNPRCYAGSLMAAAHPPQGQHWKGWGVRSNGGGNVVRLIAHHRDSNSSSSSNITVPRHSFYYSVSAIITFTLQLSNRRFTNMWITEDSQRYTAQVCKMIPNANVRYHLMEPVSDDDIARRSTLFYIHTRCLK